MASKFAILKRRKLNDSDSESEDEILSDEEHTPLGQNEDNEDDVDDIELDEEELRAYADLKAKEHAPRKERINNTLRMDEILSSITIRPEWVHSLTLTSETPLDIADFSDDLAREMAFYGQALVSAVEASNRLAILNIPMKRPDDYFAEMVKTDHHMEKVKKKLLSEQKAIVDKEDRRKQREMKKFGKQIQIQRLQEKLKKKKQNLEAVQQWRKSHNKGEDFDIGLMDDTEAGSERAKEKARAQSKAASRTAAGATTSAGPMSKKRKGAPGSATATGKPGGKPGAKPAGKKGGKPVASKRPGKSRRLQSRGKVK